MKHLDKLILLFIGLLLVHSCKNHDRNLITSRITYDVSIRNTNLEADWWNNNLPGPAREKLVVDLFGNIRSGSQKVFTSNGRLLTKDEINTILSPESSVVFQRPDPPYENFDTIIRQEFNLRDVTHMRFLEAWYSDGCNIEKEVLGFAPVVENYGPDGQFRGYEALFWIFTNDEVPGFLGQ